MEKERPDNSCDPANGKSGHIVFEILAMLRHNKKWWLIPALLIIGLAGLILILAQTGAAPFIYTLF